MAHGYDPSGNLRVQVSADSIARLGRYTAPTYVIGVDEVNERAILKAAIAGATDGFSRFPTTFPIEDERTLVTLYDEVLTFWQNHPTIFASSHFT